MLIPFETRVSTSFAGTPLVIEFTGQACTTGDADGIDDFVDLTAEVVEVAGKPVRFDIGEPDNLLDVRSVWDQLVRAANEVRGPYSELDDRSDEVRAINRDFFRIFGEV